MDRYEFHLFNKPNSIYSPNISEQKEEENAEETQKQTKGGNVTDVLKQEIEKTFGVDEEEEFDIDPQEFNIRFFDDEDEGIPSAGESNEGIKIVNISLIKILTKTVQNLTWI